MKLARSLALWALLLAALAPASAAAAETRTFTKIEHQFPSGDSNGSFGPSNTYPSTISVAGVPGTVKTVTVTLFGLDSANPDDIDMALVGPNGGQVMLMSDACGANPKTIERETWTFADAAAGFLSDNGPCAPEQIGSFRPSNYENPELDNLSKEGGGPPPPYGNSLAALAGGSAEGEWKLFILDDNKTVIGFELSAWALNLEVEPPPPAPPVVRTVTVPGPTVTVVAPSSASSGSKAAPAKTGKRAAALARCAKKKSKEERAKCRAKARKLPL